MPTDATARFSRTVENYIRYRPGYPETLFDFLKSTLHLTPQAAIADVGSGTGISTEPLLVLGNQVFAVEPNLEMRQAAEQRLSHFPNFISISGSAEATTLDQHCVDFILAGTAFHWFEPIAARRAFQRILKPGGWVLLVWNVRDIKRAALMSAYDQFLLQYSTDYAQVQEVYNNSAGFDTFFGAGNWQQIAFENFQTFDFEGFLGRYLSSSFALPENHANFAAAKAALRVMFDEHQTDGQVTFWYNTILYYGKF